MCQPRLFRKFNRGDILLRVSSKIFPLRKILSLCLSFFLSLSRQILNFQLENVLIVFAELSSKIPDLSSKIPDLKKNAVN